MLDFETSLNIIILLNQLVLMLLCCEANSHDQSGLLTQSWYAGISNSYDV